MNDPEVNPEVATTMTAVNTPVTADDVPTVTGGAVADEHASDRITVPLKRPFRNGDTTLTEVVFTRRPVAGDMVADFGTDYPPARELHVIARLLQVNPEDLKRMDALDYWTVQGKYAEFLGVV